MYAGMGGFVATYMPAKKTWHFNCQSLVLAIEKDLVPSTPPITASEIADKSKVDLVGKTVAILQICYFVVSTVVRGASHLPVSLLELGACAFVPYAIAIYACSYHKAKSPNVTTNIQHFDGKIPSVLEGLGDHSQVLIPAYGGSAEGAAISNVQCENNEDFIGSTISIVSTILLSIPFGAIHIIAWNFAFPTHIDQQLWRAASIIITTALPLVLFTPYLTGWSRFFPMVSCFLIARMIIIVEVFRTLAYLPAGSYISTWTMSVPHIG